MRTAHSSYNFALYALLKDKVEKTQENDRLLSSSRREKAATNYCPPISSVRYECYDCLAELLLYCIQVETTNWKAERYAFFFFSKPQSVKTTMGISYTFYIRSVNLN